jgi:hypothetical protein
MAAVRTPPAEPVSPLRRLLASGVPGPARWRTRLTAGLAGAALTVTALATVVAVSTDARPGDALYGLKRGTEQTQLALAGDARGQVLLDLAGTRLDEVRALVEGGATALPAAGTAAGTGPTVLAAGDDAGLVTETLATMDAQTAEGAEWLTERAVTTEDDGPLDLLAGWTATQREELSALQGGVPAAAADEVADSLTLLSDVAVRAAGLDAALDCPAGPATAGADELGPVPALCAPEGSVTTVPEAPGGGAGPTSVTAEPPPGGATVEPPLPAPTVPSGGGAVPGAPGSPGTGGLPTSAVPPLPTGALPSPTLPSTLPSVPLSVPGLPGATSSAVPSLPLDVCLGPITVGDC